MVFLLLLFSGFIAPYRHDLQVAVRTRLQVQQQAQEQAQVLQAKLDQQHVSIISGVHPTGMSYLFYYTKQDTKHRRGKNYKHQRFWIDTRCLPC